MKNFFSLLKKNKLIMPFVSLVVTGLMLVASSLAWFSMVDRVDGGGMAVSVDSRFIAFSDEIKVVRGVEGGTYTPQTVLYHRGENEKKYYEYRDGAFVLDKDNNKIPLAIKGLFPGEYLDITVSYKCSANLAGTKYRLYFADIADAGEIHGKFTVNGTKLSILGIYRWNVLNADGTEPSGKHWFSEYTVTDNADGQTVTEKINSTVELKTETWPKVEDLVSSTIRLSVDLEQYEKLKGTTSNLLSEKQFSIGTLGIGMGES